MSTKVVYTATNLSLQINFLPPFQSSAPFYWPVSSEFSKNDKRLANAKVSARQQCVGPI